MSRARGKCADQKRKGQRQEPAGAARRLAIRHWRIHSFLLRAAGGTIRISVPPARMREKIIPFSSAQGRSSKSAAGTRLNSLRVRRLPRRCEDGAPGAANNGPSLGSELCCLGPSSLNRRHPPGLRHTMGAIPASSFDKNALVPEPGRCLSTNRNRDVFPPVVLYILVGNLPGKY